MMSPVLATTLRYAIIADRVHGRRLGTLVFVSAVAGATVLSDLPAGAMEVVLSFGAAALLYLVTKELLREAHEERESTSGTAMFFVGFLLFLVIGMTLG